MRTSFRLTDLVLAEVAGAFLSGDCSTGFGLRKTDGFTWIRNEQQGLAPIDLDQCTLRADVCHANNQIRP
jgi:hypothetical protein